MIERGRSTLPTPLGELLEDTRNPEHVDELWARISARRCISARETRAPLPLPLGRALARGNDEPATRLKHWRAISTRRGMLRRPPARSRLLVSAALGSGLSAVAAVLLLVLWPQALGMTPARAPVAQALTLRSGAQLEPVEATERALELVLTDASKIRLSPGARLVPLASTDTRLDVLLERGSASFSVTPGGPRRWTIAAGLVRVEVVGTEFRVAREPSHVEVSVSHGIVLVSGPGVPNGVQRLTAGQQLRAEASQNSAASVAAPPAQAPAATVESVPTNEATASAAAAPETTPSVVANSYRRPESKPRVPSATFSPPTPVRIERAVNAKWRSELAAGRYDEAYRSLGPAEFVRTVKLAKTAEELLNLADVARLSGHAREAILPLTRLLNEFSRSPHAAVAAFTLGRALLDQLHDPRGAAAAFERAISMHPPHALLEDCHARLVQAYARIGSRAEAERAASSYRALFPNGRHLGDLESWLRSE